MHTPPGRRGGGCLALLTLTILTFISCGGNEGTTPTEPDPDAIKITTLVPGGERAKSPRWSPDGNTVAYTKDIRDDPQMGIYTVNVFVISSKGGAQTKLSNQTDNADASSPIWSPDGVSMIFSAPKSGDPFYQTDRDLWIVPRSGRSADRVQHAATGQRSAPSRRLLRRAGSRLVTGRDYDPLRFTHATRLSVL
jgi:dipeptidyl aminopeptidase/acylaminoacyl peptidase